MKVYCSNCKHRGRLIPGVGGARTLNYGHGVEIRLRTCEHPNACQFEKFDTFWKPVENHYRLLCHEINGSNDCENYEKRT